MAAKPHKAAFVRKRRKKALRPPPGAAPGTLVQNPNAFASTIHLMAYGPEGHVEADIQNPDDIKPYLAEWPVTWVNVNGLGTESVIKKLAEIFNIHILALEDVIYVHQRAKVESYASNEFAVLRMVALGERITSEQVSLFLGSRYVLTFQERPGDCLDPVRERIRHEGHRVRHAGADYLSYALLDAIIDAYYPLLEEFGDRLDALQDEVLENPHPQSMLKIHSVKQDLRVLRRAIWPLREVFNTLSRDPLPLIADETRLYFRDCYDHAVQVIDLVETYRELGSDLSDVYLSSVSNRMNEIMKVLTIIATIFIPLTFIAGIYGMNFNPEKSPWNMPELNWYYGYPFAWMLMIASAIALLLFFRRKGWIGPGNRPSPDNAD